MRFLVCLKCGKGISVSDEEYAELRERPFCDECKQTSLQKKEEHPSKRDTISKALQMTQNALDLISKKIDVKLDAKQSVSTSQKGTDPKASSVFEKAKWKHIGCLGELYDAGRLGEWSHYVGLYMHKINGKIMYIGRAVEYNNGGFRKRLSDYCRANGSARKHPSGQKIYANRYRIQTSILIVGSDALAAEKSKWLEELYIGKYNPPWNDKLKTTD